MINENTIHEESSSSFPKGLEEFRQNIKNKDNSSDIYCHNLYLLQTTDRDGNITGEAYGMNLITNWGFKEIYTSGNSYGNYRIYIGNGTDEPVLTNNALYSPIITTGSTNVNTSASIYPFQYDSSTGIITGIQRIYQGYFDYNISGITENFEITEIGYGKSTTNLISHAKIYDSEGNPSSITKRINERLTINVFWTLNMRESIIEDNYNNGVYIVMEPGFSGMLKRDREGYLYTVYGSQIKGSILRVEDYMYYQKTTMLDDNNIQSNINPNSLLIEDKRTYVSDIVCVDKYRNNSYWDSVSSMDGDINFNFMIMTKDKLPTPEELTTYEAYTDNQLSNEFNNLFGLSYNKYKGAGELPCTNFNITSLSMYNHITKEWDIEEEFVSDPNTEYDNKWRSFVRVYADFNNSEIPIWVYVNTRTDLPITSFNNSNIVLYATDKYWDTSTWELISNLSNVDESLQRKRYYIRTTETNESAKYILYPQRNMVYHKIDNIRDSYTITSITPKECYDYHAENSGYIHMSNVDSMVINLSSDEYGWILFGQKLIYPKLDGQPVYTLEIPGVKYSSNMTLKQFDQYCQWTTGDLIILTQARYGNLNVRIYNVSDPTNEPTYHDIRLGFSNISDTAHWLDDWYYNSMYRTFTEVGSGFLVCQRYSNKTYNECVIVNTHGVDGVPTQILLSDVQHCTAIKLTTNCVYLNIANNAYTFEIYDMETNEVIYSFKLSAISYDNTDNTVIGMIGWKNLIYIQVDLNGTKVTYLHDINTRVTSQLLNNINQARTTDLYTDYRSYYGYIEIRYKDNVECNDDYMIITSIGETEPNYAINYSNPSELIDLKKITPNNNSMGCKMKYIYDGRKCVCLYLSGTYNDGYSASDAYCVKTFDVDILFSGKNVNTPSLRNSITYFDKPNWYVGYCSYCIFDEGLISCSYHRKISNSSYQWNQPITWVDIKNCLPHKMTGTTTTIQAWNNPKRLQNKEYSFTLTNDTTNWGDDTNV